MQQNRIQANDDYQASLARLEEIFEAEHGTPTGDEAEHLTALIQTYEKMLYPIDPPDPISAIQFRTEQQ